LLNKLKKLTDFGRIPWESMLPKATFAVNISFNRSISTSPFIFKMKRLPFFTIDEDLGQCEITKSFSDTKEKRDEKFPRYAKRDIEKGKRSIADDLKIGDPVLIFREFHSENLKKNSSQDTQ
jgi:hypothetical protein